MAAVRIQLPDQLRRLARLEREVTVDVTEGATLRELLETLERRYPALRGTIRDHDGKRRPKVRLYACGEDISHDPLDTPLPTAVIGGEEPLIVLGAISGG